jgi:hypothetical protein
MNTSGNDILKNKAKDDQNSTRPFIAKISKIVDGSIFKAITIDFCEFQISSIIIVIFRSIG